MQVLIVKLGLADQALDGPLVVNQVTSAAGKPSSFAFSVVDDEGDA